MLRAFLTCLVAVAGVRAVLPAALSMPAAGSAAISAFLKDAVDKGQVPGIVALVVGRDGVIYHEAFGAGTPPTSRLGSIQNSVVEDPRPRHAAFAAVTPIDVTGLVIDAMRKIESLAIGTFLPTSLMQMLPFYDDDAIRILQGFERLVNQHVSR